MPPSKSTKFVNKSDYSNAVKALRKFANGFTPSDGFDLRKPYTELTPSEKGRITRYLKVVTSQTSRPFKTVQPRTKKRLRVLQEFAQQENFPKDLKVAFIPVSDPSQELKIRYTKSGKVLNVLEGGNIKRKEIPFNKQLLIDDPEGAAIEIINQAPNARRYILMANEFEIPASVSADVDSLTEVILNYQRRYGPAKFDPNDKNSHYFGNWLLGVKAYYFQNAVTWGKFVQEKAKVKRLLHEVRTTKSQKKRKVLLKQLSKYKLKAYRDKTRGKKR